MIRARIVTRLVGGGMEVSVWFTFQVISVYTLARILVQDQFTH